MLYLINRQFLILKQSVMGRIGHVLCHMYMCTGPNVMAPFCAYSVNSESLITHVHKQKFVANNEGVVVT